MSSKQAANHDSEERPLVSDNGRLLSLARKAVAVIAWIAIWEILSLVVDNEFMLASPIDSIAALFSLAQTSGFWVAILYSFLRIAIGFLAGFIIGFALGMAASRFRTLCEFLDVGMGLMKSIPLACIVVLVLIWFGAKGVTILAVFFVVAPSLYFAVKSGFGNLDAGMMQLLSLFRVGSARRFFAYELPHVMSHVSSACRLVLGMSWKAGVAAELIGIVANTIGERVYQTKLLLMTSDLFAWTFVIVVLAALSERGFMALLERMVASLQRVAALRFVKAEDANDSDFCAIVNAEGESIGEALDQVEVCFSGGNSFGPVDCRFEDGERLMIVGPSGAGKTTLLKLLLGVPLGEGVLVKGNVSIDDEIVHEDARGSKADLSKLRERIKASAIFQDQRLIEEMTPIENVMLVCGRWLAKERVVALLQELLDAEALTRPCKTLSGGQRRRVELVRAMAFPSKIVILDEPFSSLDANTAASAMRFVSEHLCGRTLILSSHDSAHAGQLEAKVIDVS